MLVKTTYPNAQTNALSWTFIDASNQVLGRLAVRITKVLMGKASAAYTPGVLSKNKVVVTNVKELRVTGKKTTDKIYTRHTGYPKGLKEQKYKEVFEKDPKRVLYKAISGMLPNNKLKKFRLANLYIYTGNEHPHKAQTK